MTQKMISRHKVYNRDCYCCSQELRPTLEEVISKLQQLMDLVIDEAANPTNEPNKTEVTTTEVILNSEEKSDVPLEGTELSMSVTIDKDKQTLPVRLEDTLTVLERAGRTVEESGNEGFDVQRGGSQLEIQTKEAFKQTVSDQTQMGGPVNQTFNDHVRHEPNQERRKPGTRVDEQNFISNTSYESQAMPNVAATQIPDVRAKTEDQLVSNFFSIPPLKGVGINYPDPRERFSEQDGNMVRGEEEATNQIATDPLPEEKTKPVLRRWREQLLVRRDRVQPWRIEMLDFPKRLPSVV